MRKVFTYCDAKGHIGAFEIANVSESAEHYQGFLINGGGIRTFRKDRMIEHFDNFASAQAGIPESYSLPKIIKPKKSTAPTICFTGFKKEIKTELTSRAEGADLGVRTGVSGSLSYLCCGANAGPVKLDKARAAGALVLSEMQFIAMLDTGEIPEHDEQFHYTLESTK